MSDAWKRKYHALTPSKSGKAPRARLDLTKMGNHSLVLQAPERLDPHTWPIRNVVVSRPVFLAAAKI